MERRFLFWKLDDNNPTDRKIVAAIGIASLVTIILLLKVCWGIWNY